MKHIFTKFKLQIIKEESGKYEIENKIDNPEVASYILRNVCNLENETEEVMMLLTLDTKNKVTGIFEVSRGSLNTSIVHPREIFKRAIINNASNVIIAHNHPSGDTTPSKEDINVTQRLKECGKILGVELLDHLIIGEGRYCSLKEKGLL